MLFLTRLLLTTTPHLLLLLLCSVHAYKHPFLELPGLLVRRRGAAACVTACADSCCSCG